MSKTKLNPCPLCKGNKLKKNGTGGHRMTEKEAKELIKYINKEYFYYDKEGEFDEINEALDMAISALEEIQQYRALGTVEELREAKRKQVPKKPILKPYDWEDENSHNPCCGLHCPTCGDLMTDYFPNEINRHCLNCGQAIDWSDTE